MDKLPLKEVSGALASVTQRCFVSCSKTNMILGFLNYFYFSAGFGFFFSLNTLPALTPAKFIDTREVSQPAHERCALPLKEMDGLYRQLTRNHACSQKNTQNLYKQLQACSVL